MPLSRQKIPNNIMIESKDLHQRHFIESVECNDKYYNFSDVPATCLIKNGEGYIPYYWNPLNNQWEAGIMVTELADLDNFIKLHQCRIFSFVSMLMRNHK